MSNVNFLVGIERRVTLENVTRVWIRLAIGKVGINVSNGNWI